jgi:hypothetical protein
LRAQPSYLCIIIPKLLLSLSPSAAINIIYIELTSVHPFIDQPSPSLHHNNTTLEIRRVRERGVLYMMVSEGMEVWVSWESERES